MVKTPNQPILKKNMAASSNSNLMKCTEPGAKAYFVPTGEISKMRGGIGHLMPYKTPALQSPEMCIPFNCRPMAPMNGGGRPNCKLALSFNNHIENLSGEQKTFADLIIAADQQAIAAIQQNVAELFPGKKKAPSAKSIAELFTPSIKANGDYMPLMSVKVPFEGDEINYDLKAPCFTSVGQAMDGKKALSAKNTVVAVIKPLYIWCINGRYGISWTLERAVVTATPADVGAFDFIFD